MIYFDNASTTKVCKTAIDACAYAMGEVFGNPASLHSFGLKAEKLIDYAKEQVALALSCTKEEILLTSGATESNNTAIYGLAENYGKRKRRIVTTAVEHPSVYEPIMRLKEKGFEVYVIEPNEKGEITADMIIDAVDEKTCIVSVMAVNNENGYILPVAEAFKEIKEEYPDCMTHCDCVQGFEKLPIKAKTLYADCLSFSGHKFFSPKGVGGLYIKKGVRVAPLLLGGGQQKGMRSGTENVPLVYALGKTIEEITPTIEERYARVAAINSYARKRLTEVDGSVINSPEKASPYILSFSLPGLKSETVLHFLEQSEIYVSSGSACSRGKKSSVLMAFGLTDKLADSAIRLSFCPDSTVHEVDMLIERLNEAVKTLARAK